MTSPRHSSNNRENSSDRCHRRFRPSLACFLKRRSLAFQPPSQAYRPRTLKHRSSPCFSLKAWLGRDLCIKYGITGVFRGHAPSNASSAVLYCDPVLLRVREHSCGVRMSGLSNLSMRERNFDQGPSSLAGEKMNPYLFSPENMGKGFQEQGIKIFTCHKKLWYLHVMELSWRPTGKQCPKLRTTPANHCLQTPPGSSNILPPKSPGT